MGKKSRQKKERKAAANSGRPILGAGVTQALKTVYAEDTAKGIQTAENKQKLEVKYFEQDYRVGRDILKTDGGEVVVSTVRLWAADKWLDIHGIQPYETMVFEGKFGGTAYRYDTREEAEEGHKQFVKRLKDYYGGKD